MKIEFEPNLVHQSQAVNAVLDVFKGQNQYQSLFTVQKSEYAPKQLDMLQSNSEMGYGNKVTLLEDEIYANTRNIQLRNGLKQTENKKQSIEPLDFSIEMETGTGKTYVYLKSIFELNKQYGFTKFIIVVPSIAIKEGVYKSLQITEEHFKKHYDETQYDYFIYDSINRSLVRDFATNDYIQIMVINIDAFSKAFDDIEKEKTANLIHRVDDTLNGIKPIDFIQSTNPIVIIDEPQTTISTENRKRAIASLNPIATFRFSATLKEAPNLLYKLDAIDAYQRKLVKQIEVASIEIANNHNIPYIRLVSVDNKKSPISANIEIDALDKYGNIQAKKLFTIKDGKTNNLYELSGNRDIYENYIINDIHCEEGNEYIDFTTNDLIIRLGESIGSVDPDQFKREQIKKTVEEHLEKELAFYNLVTKPAKKDPEKCAQLWKKKGIKVLSLFFIDRVANYRIYENGYPKPGKFALWFEEALNELLKKPKYHIIYPQIWVGDKINQQALQELIRSVHNGYFAQDKKKDANGNPEFAESKMSAKGEAASAAKDESAYNLIMKDKEKLLSINEPLRFIFSHSALKEGWDNPNVFQICTLNETKSIDKKRQEIGRGLRLAVDQSGNRAPYGFNVNTLTVMVNQSYDSFVSELHKEIEDDLGIEFNTIEPHSFANSVVNDDEEPRYLGTEQSESIYIFLQSEGFINASGKIQDKLKKALDNGLFKLPQEMQDFEELIKETLIKLTKGMVIKPHTEKETVKLRQNEEGKAIYLSPEFESLWDRIKYKTTYQVNFDENVLVQNCIEQIRAQVAVKGLELKYIKGNIEIDKGGVTIEDMAIKTLRISTTSVPLPDIVTYLTDQTQLTRKVVVAILTGIGDKLNAFKRNPQEFIQLTAKVIRDQMQKAIVDGIKYQKIGDQAFYAQTLFETEELRGSLKEMLKANKSVYEYLMLDSDTEKAFAKSLEESSEVILYTKLPSWFKIPTPLGTYNPDWAILIDKQDGNGEQLYFVVETKSSILESDLRAKEIQKIKCGKAHFEAIAESNNPAQYLVAESFDRILGEI